MLSSNSTSKLISLVATPATLPLLLLLLLLPECLNSRHLAAVDSRLSDAKWLWGGRGLRRLENGGQDGARQDGRARFHYSKIRTIGLHSQAPIVLLPALSAWLSQTGSLCSGVEESVKHLTEVVVFFFFFLRLLLHLLRLFHRSRPHSQITGCSNPFPSCDRTWER